MKISPTNRLRLTAFAPFAAAVALYVYMVLGAVIVCHHDGSSDSDGNLITHWQTARSLCVVALLGALATLLVWAARRFVESRVALVLCFATAVLLFTCGCWVTATFLLARDYIVPGQLAFVVPVTMLLLGIGGGGLAGSIPLLRQRSAERRNADIAPR